MFGLQMNLGMGSFRSKLKALFAHLFTNRTTTVDGTRYLVNEGEGDNAVMHTGQGVYFNGVDNYIDTGFVPTLENFTFLANYEIGNTANQYLLGDSSFKNYIRVRSGEGRVHDFRFGGGTSLSVNDMELSVGDKLFVAATCLVAGADKTITARINSNEYSLARQEAFDASGNNLLIGYINSTNFSNGISQGVYLIPKALTGQEIQAHYNNPEQTLYWDNGVLKSDILDQATIDSMQAGNGFWYPLTENVSAGGYYRNHALAIPSNLVVNGDFDTDSDWDKSDHWTISGGVATMPPTGTFLPIVQTINYADGVDYVVELDITAITGEIKVMSLNVAQDDSITTHITNSTGLIRLIFTGSSVYPKLAISRNRPSALASCSIRNVKVYPLANSGLTPLVNWTSTTTTNAQQLTTGYQCALQELDSFGLPIAKPDGLLHGDGKGYIASSNAISNTQSFEIDLLVDMTESDVTGFFGYRQSGTVNLYLYRQANKYLELNFQVGSTFNGFNVGAKTERIISIKYDHLTATFSFYDNNTFKKSVVSDFTSIPSFGLLARSATGDSASTSNVANLQITKGTRTDEQRTADVTKLMTKYGVTV